DILGAAGVHERSGEPPHRSPAARYRRPRQTIRVEGADRVVCDCDEVPSCRRDGARENPRRPRRDRETAGAWRATRPRERSHRPAPEAGTLMPLVIRKAEPQDTDALGKLGAMLMRTHYDFD